VSGSAGPVLVALESSGLLDAALRYACDLAVQGGRALRLVRVVEDGTVSAAEQLAGDAGERATELTGGAVPVETLTPQGLVVPVLVDLSRTADVVVLQRRQRSRLQRMGEASISTEVAGHAHATTVTVPGDWKPSFGRHHLVVVGVGRAGDDVDILRHAFARAEAMQARVTIVHGWQMDSAYDDATVDPAEVERWRQGYVDSLEARVHDLRRGEMAVPWSVDVIHTSPDSALVGAACEAGALVIGRGGSDVPLLGQLGSVARATLSDAGCPVEIPSRTALALAPVPTSPRDR
jgi:nucleotide-binding universal stress UspA family protein